MKSNINNIIYCKKNANKMNNNMKKNKNNFFLINKILRKKKKIFVNKINYKKNN